MSTPTIQKSAGAAASSEPSVDQDELIQDRIETTRFHVRLVELATNSAMLLAGILGYLLVLALIDHWIVGLNLWLRLVALVLLIVGCAVFFVVRILPCLVRAINPVYAAQAIEQASPDLKNSLINFLMLRGEDAGVKQAIYDGVRRQAASGLSEVNADTAVDRSGLIRVGYILLALVVAMAAYKILSPKDPFQSVARVAAPWQAIARPSRTTIEQVEPGNVEIYHGTPLAVTAVVRGLRDSERVELVYSTADGQMVDQTVGMSAAEGSSQFACQVSTGSMGIEQDLTYHLRAGDAVTESFRVTVKDAPAIHVQNVTYQYPTYTGLSDQTVAGQGDLSALEGTRVKIEALANQPIRSAYIELFDPTSDDPDKPVKSVPMIHEGEIARGQITLALGADRTTPMYSAFQLRFANAEGQRNRQPARYQIEVMPDLPPLVEILSPRRREIELPANRRAMVQVRALDPDFALRRVRLHAVSGGLELLKHPMLDKEHRGQSILNYDIVPAELGLAAGDTLVYWAEAEDNRRAAGSNIVEANLRRTENYRIRVIASDEEQSDEETNQDPSQTGNEQNNQGGQGDQSQADQSQDGSESADASENGENANQDSATGSEGQEPNDAGDGEQDNNDRENASPSSNNETSETESGNEEANSQSASSNDGSSGDTGQRQGEEEAVASDGSDDGEAFERILDEMRKQQEQQPTDQSDPSQNEPQDPDSGESNPGQSDPNGAQRQPADRQPNGQPQDQSDPGGERQSADDATDPQRGDETDTAEREVSDRTGNGQQRDDEQPNERSTTDRPDADRVNQDPRSADSASERSETGSSEADRNDDVTGQEPSEAERQAAEREAAEREAAEREAAEREAAERRDTDSSRSNPQDAGGQNSNEQDVADQDSADDGSADRDRSNQDPAGNQGANRPDRQPSSEESDGQEPGGDPSNDRAEDDRRGEQDRSDTPPSDPGTSSSGSNQEDAADANSQASDSTEQGTPGDNTNPSANDPGRKQSGGLPSDGTPGEGSDQQDGAGDDPNLEYTRKATDLALDYLKDRQGDRELLERLGWTPEEVQGFLRRWQQMRQNAQQQGTRGRQSMSDLEDRLKGLGLRPPGARTRRVAPQDGVLQSSDSSRSDPPAEYRDQFRAFQKSFRRALGKD